LRFVIWCGLLASACSLSAAPLTLDSLKVGPKVYRNVTVIGANATDLYFTHSQGIANVKLKFVDESIRNRFHYDPKAAADAEREQTQDDVAYQGALVSKVIAQAEKAALHAKHAANTSENSLADPINEKSLLGKPAPPLDVEKWIGEKPSLKGKAALIAFWAPWSIPCQKAIPQFNAWQKKFAENLVVVGLTSDSQAEIEEMTEPKIEFASGIDSQARLSTTAGVSSVPYVLVLDAKSIVRYQGHPGALDEKKLETLLPKPEE